MRVGRAPIDEEAIRLLEQHNPDVQFDWPRLLKAPPPEPAARRERDPRERERRERRDQRPPRPRTMETSGAAVPPMPTPDAAEAMQALAEAADRRATEHAESFAADSGEPTQVHLTEGADYADATQFQVVEYAEQSFAPGETSEPLERLASVEPVEAVEAVEAVELVKPVEPPEPLEPVEPVASIEPPTPCSIRLGTDGVTRLRARYADLRSRLADKPMEESVRAQLNAQVERLNPDAWRTSDEVTAALEEYEVVFESVRSVIGRHPQRDRRV